MINLSTPNIVVFIALIVLGGFVAGRQEMKAQDLEREIEERRKENLAKVPIIEEKLKNESLPEEERKELEIELDKSKKGMPNIPYWYPYNQRMLGWPLGIALMIGGAICLFVNTSKKKAKSF